MPERLPPGYRLSEEVQAALEAGRPVVALESTVITHGLPYPENQGLALDMEKVVREMGSAPATIAVLDGRIRIGLAAGELKDLSRAKNAHKISSRDFGPAAAFRWSGGTTVAATLVAAHAAGIRVFATGGIGGVHRPRPGEGCSTDVSADLIQLAQRPVVVVCAGAKAILDLPATLEYLETFSVPVIGYEVDEFPAFYSHASGLKVQVRAESAAEVARIARAHWGLGFQSAVLVVVPPPQEAALPQAEVAEAIEQALREAGERDLRGQAVTPFLLERVSELTGGASLEANLALLRNNAGVAAGIAGELAAV